MSHSVQGLPWIVQNHHLELFDQMKPIFPVDKMTETYLDKILGMCGPQVFLKTYNNKYLWKHKHL